MPDVLDRTVTITLKAVNDAYINSVQQAAKATDAAVSSMAQATTGAGEAFHSLADTVAATGATSAEAATQTKALSDSLTDASKTLTANASAAAQAAENNAKLAASAQAATQAAATQAAATEKSAAAVGETAQAATKATEQLKTTAATVTATGQAASAAGAGFTQAAQQTSVASKLFGELKSEAFSLVPGLGSIATMAAGAATGLGALQIAEKVGSWLIDVGAKALESSGQLGRINALVGQVTEAFSGLVGKGIAVLATAITTLVGPALEKLVSWVSEGLKWVTAFGDWFEHTVFGQTAAKALDGVSKGFDQVGQSAQASGVQVAQAVGTADAALQKQEQVVVTWSGLWAQAWKEIKEQAATGAGAVNVALQVMQAGLANLGLGMTSAGGKTQEFGGVLNFVKESLSAFISAHTVARQAIEKMIPPLAEATGKSKEYAASVADAVAKEKAQAEERAKQAAAAKLLADQQGQLGLVTKQTADAAAAAAAQTVKAWDALKESAQQGAAATVAAYNSLVSQQKTVLAGGTADQAKEIAAQIANIQSWAAAHGIALGEVKKAVVANTDAIHNFSQSALKNIYAVWDAIAKVDQLTIDYTGDTKTASEAVAQMAATAAKASAGMVDGIDDVKFATDAAVAHEVEAVTKGYNQQMQISRDSLTEQIRITQAYWAALADTIQTNWDTMTTAEKQAAADAGAVMQANADRLGIVLRTTTATVKTETIQQGQMWTDLGKNMERAMRQAASSMADALVSGDKSFGEIMKTMLKDLEKAILQTFLKTGLDAVTNFISKAFTGEGGLLSVFSSATKQATELGKSIADVSKNAANMGSSAGATGGGGAGGIGGALGGIGGAINVVSGAISAISSVIGIFQMRGQTKVMENVQDATLRLYYTTHDFFTEWHNFAWGWVPATYVPFFEGVFAGFVDVHQMLQANLDQLWMARAALTDTIAPALAKMAEVAAAPVNFSSDSLVNAFSAVGQTIVSAINAAANGIISAIQGLGRLGAGATQVVAGETDLSPVTGLLTQIRDALSQGALRPNVAMNVAVGPSTQEVAQAIVRNLQLAGVVR